MNVSAAASGDIQSLFEALATLVPVVLAMILIAMLLWWIDRHVLRTWLQQSESARVFRRVIVAILIFAAMAVVSLVIPMSNEVRGHVFGLLGLIVTVVVTLSSTTFVANTMAGFMLRAVGSFRIGDFVRVGEHFGRVTERGLLHTEIQTEDRDLTTLPNLFLVSNPVSVVRESGTIISATVSLGYDVRHDRVSVLLVAAAEETGLESPFVHVTELGDYSVSYRVAGFLADVKKLLTVRSQLRVNMLDQLHGDGVEIVSPTFMAQRPLDPSLTVLPPIGPGAAEAGTSSATAESIVFDKADRAAQLASLRERHVELKSDLEKINEEIADADERRTAYLEGRQASIEREIQFVERMIEFAEKAVSAGEDPS